MTAVAPSRPASHSPTPAGTLSPAGWATIALITFAYAAYGAFTYRAADTANSGGYFSAGTFAVGVLCDPLFVAAMLFAWGLVAARRAGEMTTPEMITRAGRYQALLAKKLIPWAIRASTLVWLVASAVVSLVTLGSWAASGFARVLFAPSDALLLTFQLVSGILVFTVFAALIDISAMVAPERLRFAFPTLIAMSLWVALFTSNFLGDRLPEPLRAIHVLTAAATGGDLSNQLGRLAHMGLALVVLHAAASVLDRVKARRRALATSATIDPLLVVGVAATVTATALAAGQGLVSELFAGYRGSLAGALIEAALTVAPAAATWVALASREAVGWSEVYAMRAGTRGRAFTRRLRHLFARCVVVWSWIAVGCLVGLLVARQPLIPADDLSAIVAFSLAGGLVQTLVYVTLIHFVSQFVRSDAVMIGFVVVLVVLPLPGASIALLPLHRAFNSLLVTEDPWAALLSLTGLCLGLALMIMVAVGTLTALDRYHSRKMAHTWTQQYRPASSPSQAFRSASRPESCSPE